MCHHQHPQDENSEANHAGIEKIRMAPAIDELLQVQQAEQTHETQHGCQIHNVTVVMDDYRTRQEFKRKERQHIHSEPGAQVMPAYERFVLYDFAFRKICCVEVEPHIGSKEARQQDAGVKYEEGILKAVDELQRTKNGEAQRPEKQQEIPQCAGL